IGLKALPVTMDASQKLDVRTVSATAAVQATVIGKRRDLAGVSSLLWAHRTIGNFWSTLIVLVLLLPSCLQPRECGTQGRCECAPRCTPRKDLQAPRHAVEFRSLYLKPEVSKEGKGR